MMMACHRLDGLVMSVNNRGGYGPLRRRHIDGCRVFSVDKSTSSHITQRYALVFKFEDIN